MIASFTGKDAYLDETVMEVNAEEGSGEANVLLEELCQVVPDEGLHVGAGGLVEVEGEATHDGRVLISL